MNRTKILLKTLAVIFILLPHSRLPSTAHLYILTTYCTRHGLSSLRIVLSGTAISRDVIRRCATTGPWILWLVVAH